jgi:hypothetical protein
MAAAGVEAEEAVVVNQDYSDRPGYDPNFLDTLKVPLPAISDAMQHDTATVRPDARKNGDPFELAYYHYSVYMNKRRRTAWFSAANVDGDHRPQIGKRQGDRWYQDTRILKTEQLGQNADAEMKYITVNPTWNVPPSIVSREYLPALAQDPTVLGRMGLRVSYNPDVSIHISQPPGDHNALGRLRFNWRRLRPIG